MPPESDWVNHARPGYFGYRRNAIIAAFNRAYGLDGWRLRWVVDGHAFDFNEACACFYGEAYFRFLRDNPAHANRICAEYADCIDNAETNITSGLDYTKQESRATHIQDIAVRNALHRLGKKFIGPPGTLLVVRSKDTDGYFLSPGKVPFHMPQWITAPHLLPRWADYGSVEDFWQSNKWVQLLADVKHAVDARDSTTRV